MLNIFISIKGYGQYELLHIIKIYDIIIFIFTGSDTDRNSNHNTINYAFGRALYIKGY